MWHVYIFYCFNFLIFFFYFLNYSNNNFLSSCIFRMCIFRNSNCCYSLIDCDSSSSSFELDAKVSEIKMLERKFFTIFFTKYSLDRNTAMALQEQILLSWLRLRQVKIHLYKFYLRPKFVESEGMETFLFNIKWVRGHLSFEQVLIVFP